VGKTKSYVVGHYSGTDWVERRKRKKVILEELMNINTTLNFFKPDGSIDKASWKAWKKTLIGSPRRRTTSSCRRGEPRELFIYFFGYIEFKISLLVAFYDASLHFSKIIWRGIWSSRG
jgi:hypothetical protein